MALTILPAFERCFDCEELKDDVEWHTILETEDDGFDLPLCVKCTDKRIN